MLPDLHDWEIIEIALDRFKHTIKFVLTMPATNEKKTLILQGVSKFFLTGMAIQNVILDLILFEEDSDSDYFKHCCSILKIAPSSFANNKSDKIIYFEPSVGAEIACCFTDYSFDN